MTNLFFFFLLFSHSIGVLCHRFQDSYVLKTVQTSFKPMKLILSYETFILSLFINTTFF
jgi:hypothetical protein